MKIYLSAALLASRNLDEAKARYQWLQEEFKKFGQELYLPHRHTDPVKEILLTATEVFRRDNSVMLESDFILTLLEEPSLGVGAEVVLCLERNKKLVAFVPDKKMISRFLIGYIESKTTGKVLTYNSFIEIPDLFQKFLKNNCVRYGHQSVG